MYKFIFIISFLSCISCKDTPNLQEPKVELSQDIPAIFKKGIEAHGGWEAWKEMKTLEFSIIKNAQKEKHTIDLISRKARIEHPNWTIGFDGSEVWITPDKEAFGKRSPRFYHNLYFYFFAMPFVLADPGIEYEVMEPDSLNGQLYNPVKISFKEGVGDAPEDIYIAYFDQTSHIMSALLYTVTYYSGEASQRYNALIYDNWIDVNGLKLPASFKGYTYENGDINDIRYDLGFEGISLSEQLSDPSIFEMPPSAEVDTLIQH